MLTFKNKKETLKEHPHIDVFNNGEYIGYIIKTLPTEPKGWGFVNKSQYPLWLVKDGVNRVLVEKTKTKLIEKIKEILANT
jgi:hypothetical protein